jgi:hypothetical protein
MVAVRFHELIEHEPVNQEWVARLEQLSKKFGDLGQTATGFVASPGGPSAAAPAVSSPRSA